MKAFISILFMGALFLFSSANAAGGANSGAVNPEQLQKASNAIDNSPQAKEQAPKEAE